MRRAKQYHSIYDALEINGVAMQSTDNAPCFILSYDTLYVGKHVTQAVKDYALQTHQIEADQMMLLASHTHFAPNIDKTKPLLGEINQDYVEFVIAQSKALLDTLVEKLTTAENHDIKYGQNLWNGAINRRHPAALFISRLLNRSGMAPHKNGACDKNIRIFQFENNGTSNGFIVSVACHPVTFPHLQISSDFIGVIRRALKEKYGDVPIVFMQGFSGDIRPNVQHSSGLKFDRHDEAGWKKWSNILAQKVMDAVSDAKTMPTTTLNQTLQTIPIQNLFKKIEDTNSLPPHLKIHTINIGTHKIVALNAEVLSQYINELPGNAVPVSCLEDTFGYLPHKKDIPRGGYEVALSQSHQGFKATFKKQPLDLKRHIT